MRPSLYFLPTTATGLFVLGLIMSLPRAVRTTRDGDSSASMAISVAVRRAVSVPCAGLALFGVFFSLTFILILIGVPLLIGSTFTTWLCWRTKRLGPFTPSVVLALWLLLVAAALVPVFDEGSDFGLAPFSASLAALAAVLVGLELAASRTGER